MKIELNIQSQEFLYESQILINAFLAECRESGGNPEYPEWNQKKLQIYIGAESIKVCCEDICFTGVPKKSEKKYVKAELKRLVYKTLRELSKKELPWGALTGIRPIKLAMGLIEGKQEISDEEIYQYLKENYLVSDKKAALSIEIARREYELLKSVDYKDGYSLYVGIPFCPTTCLYCSFTSYPIKAYQKKTEAYLAALIKEVEYTAEKFKNKKLNTIYFGGGTPTSLEAEQLDRLLSAVRDRFDLSWNQEFTVEAGRPDSITKEKLQVLKRHGVTRISINPQTMNQKTLDFIGRYHTVGQVKEAFWLAREMGFDNINMDFIAGLPCETAEDIEYSMQEAKTLNPDSLTIHSLAIKRAARLNIQKEQYKELMMRNSMEIMEMCGRYAKEMGMKPYYLYRQKNMAGNMENVGYARKAGIYNILIMEEKQTIAALGAGSISKRVYPDGRIERCENVKDVALYIEKIDEMIERKRKLFMDL